MTREHFDHVTTWVFDLDNTLYHPSARLFDQIELRMTDWMMRTLKIDRASADTLRGTYWRDHGTTLAGLMRHHGVDPGPYLDEVHDIDFSVLTADAALAGSIAALPGRRIIFTNGSAPYAENVLQARGLSGLFDAVYGVEHAGFHPKPDRAAFDTVFAADGLDPARAAMFEDDPRNLVVPHGLGMKTVLVADTPTQADHIQFHAPDLTAFLSRLI